MARFQNRPAQRFSAADPETTESSDVVPPFPASDEAAEPISPPPTEDDSAATIELFHMDDAPKTGVLVNLQRPDGALVEARWRAPRRFEKTRWVVDAGWFYSGSGAPRIDFEPVAWARAWA